MNKIKKGKRLYQDLVNLGSYFACVNQDLKKAVRQKHILSALEILLFDEITQTYDSNQQQPCLYTIDELATEYSASRSGIGYALTNLVEMNLIIRVGQRKGRAKSKFLPNVEYLHSLLLMYVKARSV